MKARFLILMAFLFVLSVRQINAQACSYQVINNLNCSIKLLSNGPITLQDAQLSVIHKSVYQLEPTLQQR
jgi:hypothetical protein